MLIVVGIGLIIAQMWIEVTIPAQDFAQRGEGVRLDNLILFLYCGYMARKPRIHYPGACY